jgi:hypothetical protein
MISSAAQPSMTTTRAGSTGETSHSAVASSSTPKAFLDPFHPRSGLRQQRAAGGADGDQRRAHAERHDEQRRAAEHGVAGLADVEQRAGQRRGDAGADDQRRQRAHQEDADAAAALQVAGFFRQLALQRGRQLQFVEAEHRQRQDDEDQREGAEHPGVLQGRREQRAAEPGGDADRRVGQRHAQHVGSDSAKPRACEALWPWPAMMPERMGIIGKTQGVSDRPRPARKKKARMAQKPASFSVAAIRPLSSPHRHRPGWPTASSPDRAASG